MRTYIVLGLALVGLSIACAVQPADEAETTSDQGQALQPLPMPPVETVVNCDSPANYSCFECGNHDGVMCCVGKCTVIPPVNPPRCKCK